MGSRRATSGLPTWLVVGSVVLVVLAILAFFYTENRTTDDDAADPNPTTPTDTGGGQDGGGNDNGNGNDNGGNNQGDGQQNKKRPKVNVFNTTSTAGMAADAADMIKKRKWKIGKVDDFDPAPAATTVYYAKGDKKFAKKLARQFDITTVKKATKAMSAKRLTVLLTAPL